MKKTLDNLEKGDYVLDGEYYRKVLSVLEEGLYVISRSSKDIDGGGLKKVFSIHTAYDLKVGNYTIYQPEETPNATVIEAGESESVTKEKYLCPTITKEEHKELKRLVDKIKIN